MRKLMLMTAMIVLIGMAGFAQSFEKGNQGINVGLGLGPGYHSHGYGFPFGVNASYEYAIVEVPMGSSLTGVVGVGGYVGVSFSSKKYGAGNLKYNTTDFTIAARATYHFIFHDKFDPYAGIILGYHGSSQKYKGDQKPPDSKYTYHYFAGGVFVGARYFFTDNFGAYAELGYMINIINLGVTFKID
jgi:hypothetical protein